MTKAADKEKPAPGKRRIRTPTVLQMEAVECGAASLAMVLGWFGRHVPLEILRYECGVSRDGTKASNIVKAARRFGLQAKGFSTEPAGLRKMALPLIVFWNFNHFVVVEGFGKGGVFLNDPATGPRLVSDAEFDEAFTGVALAFEPGPDFVKGGRRPNVWVGLRKRLLNSRSAFFYVVLASLFLVVPDLLLPAFSRVYVDYYLVQGFKTWLTPVLLGMAGIAVLKAALTWLQRHYLLRFQTKLAVTGASAFFWHVLRLPVGFFAQRYGGEVGSRVSLNDRVAQLISDDLAVTAFGLVTMTVYATVMLQYDALLTLIAVVFAGLNLIAFRYVSRQLADGAQKLLLDQGKLLGVVMQGLQMIESFKASGTEGLFFARWAGYHAKVINAEQTLARYRLLLGASPILLSMLGSATILVIGGFRVMEGMISIGTLVAFQALLASFTAPVIGLVELGRKLQEAQGDIIRLDDIMMHEVDREFVPGEESASKDWPVPAKAPPISRQAPEAHPKPRSATAWAAASPAAEQLDEIPKNKLTGRVQLRDVTFGFTPNDPPLVSNFSLDLQPGSRVALVGGSGSGKSTIGKLIAGLYIPWSGEILFDGLPRPAIPRGVFHNSVAVVDQEISLFEGSVSENISFFDPTMAEDRIIRAARDAAIHDEITERIGSYAFRLREGGSNFSGGQRQRLEIARALASNPAILILDEATSALDTVAERLVIENVRLRGCTCIVIAHRLSTIRDCDEIIVLDHGQVVERGTHSSLIAGDGAYRSLIEA